MQLHVEGAGRGLVDLGLEGLQRLRLPLLVGAGRGDAEGLGGGVGAAEHERRSDGRRTGGQEQAASHCHRLVVDHFFPPWFGSSLGNAGNAPRRGCAGSGRTAAGRSLTRADSAANRSTSGALWSCASRSALTVSPSAIACTIGWCWSSSSCRSAMSAL